MDWFERLTGFAETDPATTRSRLALEGTWLRSLVNGRRWQVGTLDLVSLQTLRQRVAGGAGVPGTLQVSTLGGDVRAMHRQPGFSGALFQVASQFNLLEMVGPGVSPEDGVTRYQHDHTQGPACAMAAGAATIYRNHFAPVDGASGQTRTRQLDGLRDLGAALSAGTGLPVDRLWTMRNGYALCTAEGLAAISAHLAAVDEPQRDALRALLRVGLHSDVEVTDVEVNVGQVRDSEQADAEPRPLVSQVFCSALPVAYTRLPSAAWAPFARLVLEAAYEATLCAALLNARRGASKVLLLTRLGGGAFGNDDAWIDAAMARALDGVRGQGLDVRLVSHGAPPRSMVALAARYRS